jgi:PhnB protein
MTNAPNPVPATSSPLIPMLVCRDVGAQLEFCKMAFEPVEVSRRPGPDGNVVHALIKISEAMVIIEGEWPTLASRAPQGDGSSPVVIFVYVTDVDAVTERAGDAGATILAFPQNQFWGDRTARILDPAGHVWLVATRIEETSEGQRAARWSDILEGKKK